MEQGKSKVELGMATIGGGMAIATGWWVNAIVTNTLAFAILMTCIGGGLILVGIGTFWQGKKSPK